MREYMLDEAETALRDYLEARRRREQPQGITGRLEEWTPDDTLGPDGTYEDLVGLVRHVPSQHVRVLELYYYGAHAPQASQRRLTYAGNTALAVAVDEWMAEDVTAESLAAYLGAPWTAEAIRDVRRRAIRAVETALLDRLVRAMAQDD